MLSEGHHHHRQQRSAQEAGVREQVAARGGGGGGGFMEPVRAGANPLLGSHKLASGWVEG